MCVSLPAAQNRYHFHLVFFPLHILALSLLHIQVLQSPSTSVILLPPSWGFTQRRAQPSARVSHEPDGTSCQVHADVTHDSTQRPVIKPFPASACISHCQTYTDILYNIWAASLEGVPREKLPVCTQIPIASSCSVQQCKFILAKELVQSLQSTLNTEALNNKLTP